MQEPFEPLRDLRTYFHVLVGKDLQFQADGTPERRTLTFLQILHRWIGYLSIIQNIAINIY
jgi:hypothetical protein